MTSSHPGVILPVNGGPCQDPFWGEVHSRAAARHGSVALVEAEDPRILSAASYLGRNGLAKPVLVGDGARVSEAMKAWGFSPMPCLEPRVDERTSLYGAALLERRRSKGLTEDQARNLVLDPLFFGAMSLKSGHVDALVAGAVRTTADTVRAGLVCLGLGPSADTAFGAFLLDCPHAAGGRRVVLVADAAVSPHPSARNLAAVGVAAGALFEKWVGKTAHVAFLSFSTRGSAQDESVDVVRRAVDIARGKSPGLDVDGELQADAALVDWIARQKGVDPTRARANVLVFPDLNAGNSGYKLVQHLGGARAVGPVIAGLSRPFSDLSRGCTDEDIVNAAALSLLL